MDESLGHIHYTQRASWLRAALLGASDGLVSNGSLLLGLLAANNQSVLLAGVAGLVAGSLSMALGEWISVSSQRDSEQADIALERAEHMQGESARLIEYEELVENYCKKGLSEATARLVATELSSQDIEQIIRIHVQEELGIDIDDLTNPLQAAVSSALSFVVGALPPIIVVLITKDQLAGILGIVISTLVFLAIFGAVGSLIGGGKMWKGALRVTVGGTVALGCTFGVGILFNHLNPTTQ